MPEIKHNFTGGKMNKDLDDRLVPNGQYRNAINIQVSTSEGSDIGTVQNILGNSQVSTPLAEGLSCVGSISNEKSDSSYFFLSGPRPQLNPNIIPSSGVFSRDFIVKLKNNVTSVVFSDVKQFIAKTINPIEYSNKPTHDYSNKKINIRTGEADGILVGDILERIVNTSQNTQQVISCTVVFVYTSQITNAPDYVILDNLDGTFTQNDEYALFFRSGCLRFDSNNPITGVNIIDDMLFWTDGITEPKKINITRSIQGTDQTGIGRTLLVNEDQNITTTNGVVVKEKHIAAIKIAPSKPPALEALTSVRQSGVSGEALDVNFMAAGGGLMSEGDSLTIYVSSALSSDPPMIEVGDTILLNNMDSQQHPPENYEVRAMVDSMGVNGVYVEISITLISISANTTQQPFVDYFVAVSKEGYNLFEHKFPRFAYRYKYKDGEYSSIGPFSGVAFVPGHFHYHPTEAYNKGMVNNLKSLQLKDFIPHDIPKDVIEVDLLYKDEVSPSIYTVRTITPLDSAWSAEGSFPGSFGSYNITTENITAVLPSNQGLRLWDNVPRAALAQEVIGNRVVYANYLQNYNIETLPSVIASLSARYLSDEGLVGKKSIKSLRTYNVGIVYGDQYGRETPVFANESSNQIVTKDKAGISSLLKAKVNGSHPSWAKYYKFYVKETSSEYYNLALGRVYDAEDGNIWLSFPSVDRNKIDEDTYLILKKGAETKQPVESEARYKVVSIKNEAPDYIKTTYTTIARPVAWPITNTEVTFGGAGNNNTAKYPVVGGVSFYIDQSVWTKDSSIPNSYGMPNLVDLWDDRDSNDLYVSFLGHELTYNDNGSIIQSGKYLITNVVALDAGIECPDQAVFEVFISSPILPIDDWIANPSVVITQTAFRPVIHKKEVKNKPEFDGRFFVKIKNDSTAELNLRKEKQEDISWKVTAGVNIYHARDSEASNYNVINDDWHYVWQDIGCTSADDCINDSNGVSITTQELSEIGDVENLHGVNKHGTYTKAQWNKLLEWGGGGGGGGAGGRWFIDQASFAGTQPLDTESFSAAQTTNSATDFTSEQTYQRELGTIEETDYWGTGESLGTQWQTGISGSLNTDLPNNREHKLKLSFSGLKPDQGYDADGNYYPLGYMAITGVEDNGWDVGASNSFTAEQEQFASQIKQGSVFRMQDEPQITYTITNVAKIRMYNYRSGYPSAYTEDGYYTHESIGAWWYINMKQNFGASGNRRLCYDITYTIDGGNLANDLSLNPALTKVNSINSGGFQFVQPFDPDEVEPISSNPAIFETEPKEDSNLDIYYEASGRIPTSILGGDGEMLIPIGSTMQLAPDVADNISDGVTADGWGEFLTPGNYKPNFLNISPHLTLAQAMLIWPTKPQGAPTVAFNTPFGGVSYVRIIDWLVVDKPTEMVLGFLLEPLDTVGLGWFNCYSFGNGVESNRVGDVYNKPYLANGAKASTTLDKKYEEESRKSGLIYSGIFNSMSGVNNLNQFIAAEKITKDINPIYGGIQKLYARSTADGDLITLCEDRVLKILANKDALFNADGNPQLIATENVLGQAMPFSGEYGISKNPESFAAESYRAYFTDKVRGAVMRLSKDGLTPISDHGMKVWFRDNLKLSSKIVGSFDSKKDEYNVTLLIRDTQTFSYYDDFVLKSTAAVMIPSVALPPNPGPSL